MKVGKIFEFEHMISQSDVETYAKLSTDFNSIHLVDASKGDKIEDKIVHGMLIVATITSDLQRIIKQNFKLCKESTIFKVPLKMNEKFTSKIEVLAFEGNNINFIGRCFNASGQQLMIWKCDVEILSKLT
ncbi:MAG: MaoC/PaaZ C-terminal domain-containing protein [Fusobacteria bacterium]|nr:MaoC/PaaZ C-terminal domain-containing protein [Fusobacteriota bacterium]